MSLGLNDLGLLYQWNSCSYKIQPVCWIRPKIKYGIRFHINTPSYLYNQSCHHVKRKEYSGNPIDDKNSCYEWLNLQPKICRDQSILWFQKFRISLTISHLHLKSISKSENQNTDWFKWLQDIMSTYVLCPEFNTLRPKQNHIHFPNDIFKCISWTKMFEFLLRFHWSLFL